MKNFWLDRNIRKNNFADKTTDFTYGLCVSSGTTTTVSLTSNGYGHWTVPANVSTITVSMNGGKDTVWAVPFGGTISYNCGNNGNISIIY